MIKPAILAVCLGASGLAACSNAEPVDPACVNLPPGLPADVYCTGLYLHRDPARIAPDALPYTPGVTLWSDGADKRRYLYLPASSTIDTTNFDAWKFPVGTKVWKEFRVGGALVETRLLWKQGPADWQVGTYVWDDAGTGATLNTSAPKGVLRPDGYEIPTTKDCAKCHDGASDKVLGVEAVALALPAARGVTLADLVRRGALSAPPSGTAIALPEDATGKAGAALGYLHANCGMPCHSTRGIGDAAKLVLRLRADEFWTSPGATGAAPATTATDTFKGTVNQPPNMAAVASRYPGLNRIVPGAHDKSLIWVLAHLRDGKYQMPPLVSHRIDDTGTQALADWIDSLRP